MPSSYVHWKRQTENNVLLNLIFDISEIASPAKSVVSFRQHYRSEVRLDQNIHNIYSVPSGWRSESSRRFGD